MTMMTDLERCLREFDVDGAVRLWAQMAPHLPQPTSRVEAEMTLHYSRTISQTLELRPRAYSHRWLTERSLPSGLPDELRPKAERMFPKVVEAVGIASITRTSTTLEARKAMSDAVEDIYADTSHPDPNKVKARIMEVRNKVIR